MSAYFCAHNMEGNFTILIILACVCSFGPISGNWYLLKCLPLLTEAILRLVAMLIRRWCHRVLSLWLRRLSSSSSSSSVVIFCFDLVKTLYYNVNCKYNKNLPSEIWYMLLKCVLHHILVIIKRMPWKTTCIILPAIFVIVDPASSI